MGAIERAEARARSAVAITSAVLLKGDFCHGFVFTGLVLTELVLIELVFTGLVLAAFIMFCILF